jgi:hypothetical protein
MEGGSGNRWIVGNLPPAVEADACCSPKTVGRVAMAAKERYM